MIAFYSRLEARERGRHKLKCMNIRVREVSAGEPRPIASVRTYVEHAGNSTSTHDLHHTLFTIEQRVIVVVGHSREVLLG